MVTGLVSVCNALTSTHNTLWKSLNESGVSSLRSSRRKGSSMVSTTEIDEDDDMVAWKKNHDLTQKREREAFRSSEREKYWEERRKVVYGLSDHSIMLQARTNRTKERAQIRHKVPHLFNDPVGDYIIFKKLYPNSEDEIYINSIYLCEQEFNDLDYFKKDIPNELKKIQSYFPHVADENYENTLSLLYQRKMKKKDYERYLSAAIGRYTTVEDYEKQIHEKTVGGTINDGKR